MAYHSNSLVISSIQLQAYSPLGSAGGPLMQQPLVQDLVKKYEIEAGTVLLSYLNNRGIVGEFLAPLVVPKDPGSSSDRFDGPTCSSPQVSHSLEDREEPQDRRSRQEGHRRAQQLCQGCGQIEEVLYPSLGRRFEAGRAVLRQVLGVARGKTWTRHVRPCTTTSMIAFVNFGGT